MRHAILEDPELPLSDLMRLWPQTIPVFLKHHMLCVGCLIGPYHCIADACAEHHLNEDLFVSELLDALDVV